MAGVIVVDRSPAALGLAEGYGAAHTVLVGGTHVAAVRDLTEGGVAHIVFDFVAEKGTEAEGVELMTLAAQGKCGRTPPPTR